MQRDMVLSKQTHCAAHSGGKSNEKEQRSITKLLHARRILHAAGGSALAAEANFRADRIFIACVFILQRGFFYTNGRFLEFC
jgi:hypothetical protein